MMTFSMLRATTATASRRPITTRTLASSAPERVVIKRDSHGVATVQLKRGAKMNALDLPMFNAIRDAARELADDKDIRAVVLHGEGRAFCSGIDVKSVFTTPGATSTLMDRPAGEISNLAQDVSYLWRRVPVPVIAATHGVCLGGGFQIALGADMRVSTPTCKFSILEAKWGLIPDMGASVVLPELVPKDVAMELTMTGRFFDGNEALRLGLVTKLADDPLAEAVRLACEIATRSPDSTAAAKRLLHATYASEDDGRRLGIEEALQRRVMGGWNQIAMVAKGLGVPKILQPGFRNRDSAWSAEADEEAERQLQALLDTDYSPPEANEIK